MESATQIERARRELMAAGGDPATKSPARTEEEVCC